MEAMEAMNQKLMIKLFGPPKIITDTGPLKFETRKAIALLAYLAIEGCEKPVSRNMLSDLLWPATDEKKSRTNLRYTFHVLQKAVGKSYFEADRQEIKLIPSSDISVDFWGFHQALSQGNLSGVINLASSQFLDGFELADAEPFEEWRLEIQAEINRQLAESLEKIISTQNETQPNELQKHAEQLIKIDPYNEVSYRALMRLAFDTGRRTDSLRWYETCVELLHLDLGIDPQPETIKLHNEILVAGAELHKENRVSNRANGPTQEGKSLFFGRKQELNDIKTLVKSGSRLVTILGEGGIGKTRLATELCSDLAPHFPDGGVLVPLVAVESTEQIVAAIANRLNLQFVDSIDPVRQLINFLKPKKLLLVLDNLEHLIGDQLLDLIAGLNEQTDQITILGTSRERLKLRAEHPYRLQSLSEEPHEAQALFLNRARPYLQAGLDQSQVKEICHLVGEIPLALEMAAALTATLPLNDIIYALRQNLDILQTDFHDVPARHSSLKGVYDTSWQMLSKQEQETFAAFSTFRGGGTAVAINEITKGGLNVLQNLVNKSFLNRVGERFEVHELLRQYGEEKLKTFEQTEIDQLRKRHTNYYIDQFETLFVQEAELSEWIADFQNLRLGWHWTLSQKDDAQLGRVIPLVWHYFEQTHRFTEAIDLFEAGRKTLANNPQLTAHYLELSYLLGLANIRLGRHEVGVDALLTGTAAAGYPLPPNTVRLLIRFAFEYLATRSRLFGPLWQIWQKPPSAQQIRAAQAFLQAGTILYYGDHTTLCLITMLKGCNLTEGLPEDHPIRLYGLSIVCVFYILTHQQRQVVFLERRLRSVLKSAAHHPYHNAVYNSLVALNVGRKSWDSLLADLNESLRIAEGPDVEHFVGNSYTLKAVIETRSGRMETGLRTYDTLLSHSQKNFNTLETAIAFLGKGITYLRQGHFEESEACLKDVIKMLNSGVKLGNLAPWPYASIGLLYARQGRWAEADDVLTQILPFSAKRIPINAQNISLYVHAAEAQFLLWHQGTSDKEIDLKTKRQERLKNAFSMLRRFARIHPIARPEYKWLRGRHLLILGRKRRGKRLLEQGFFGVERYDMPYVSGQIAADLYFYTNDPEWYSTAKTKLTVVGATYELAKLENAREARKG